MARHVSAPQQEALWWIQQRSSAKDLYNLTWRMSVGSVDAAALGRAWQAVVDRHEALRTALVHRDGTVWQDIQADVAVTAAGCRGFIAVDRRSAQALRRHPEALDGRG